jgi:hypothetical protein
MTTCCAGNSGSDSELKQRNFLHGGFFTALIQSSVPLWLRVKLCILIAESPALLREISAVAAGSVRIYI